MNDIRTATHVYFMARPKSKATDPRSYLVKCPREPYAHVRVMPPAGGIDRTFNCGECKSNKCKHVKAATKVDLDKFPEINHEK